MDYVDKEIKHSTKLVGPNVHLQLWCGRIDSFGLVGIPYVEQIGRPINLGVGVVQELDSDCAVVLFKLADVKRLLLPLVLDYQNDENYQPQLFELHGLGINGDLTLWKDLNQSGNSLSTRAEQTGVRHTRIQAQATEIKRDLPHQQQRFESNAGRSQWLDDLVFLSRKSLRVLDLLCKYSRSQESKVFKNFLAVASRKRDLLTSQNVGKEWRGVYKCLADAWSIITPWNFVPITNVDKGFWQYPGQGIKDSNKVALLNRHLDLLAESLDGESPLQAIEYRFEQISDTFKDILLGMLDS
ncbi:hypothetical protein [Cyanobium sp. ULC082]